MDSLQGEGPSARVECVETSVSGDLWQKNSYNNEGESF